MSEQAHAVYAGYGLHAVGDERYAAEVVIEECRRAKNLVGTDGIELLNAIENRDDDVFHVSGSLIIGYIGGESPH